VTPFDPALGDRLLALGAATLGESGGWAMRARIRAAWPGATIVGPAFTASCHPGDNLAIHAATAIAPAGSVLVAETGDVSELGYWGEVLTTAAESRGVRGLVIDAGVRDVAALAEHGFGVFSTMTALRGATKTQPGTVGMAVTVGDVEVNTGDWIVGDADGVVVIPAERLDAVLDAGEQRALTEQRMFVALRAGNTTVDLLQLDTSRIRYDR
jgi:4-hydroxy-4-methyl-2-oxoglutarate aldolase